MMVMNPGQQAGSKPRLWVWLAVIFAATFGLSFAVALTLFLRFGTSMDLAIFYQGLANMAGRYPAGVAIKLPGAELFGDHFHPIVLLALPLLAVWPSPVALLVLQSGALGLTTTILAHELAWARGRLEPLALLGLLTSPAIWAAASFDFHEVALGSPLVALLCAAIVRERWVLVAQLGMAAMLIKEDMGALILPCVVLLWRAGRGWLAGVLATWVMVWTLVVTRWVIPAFNANHVYTYASGGLLAKAASSLWHALAWPGLLTVSTAVILAATGFRFAPPWLLLPVAGNLLYRACAGNFRYWVPAYHYWLLPFVFIAFASLGSRPLRGWRLRLVAIVTLAGVVAGPATWALKSVVHTQPRVVNQVLPLVPQGSWVATDPRFAAALAQRAVVSVVGPDDDAVPEGVNWVVLDTSTTSYDGPGWVAGFAGRLKGFDVVGNVRAPMLVLHRRVPAGHQQSCQTSDLGSLCVNARARFYDVVFTPSSDTNVAGLDFNLTCADGHWFGVAGDIKQTSDGFTNSFYVGRTTHDSCSAALLLDGRPKLTTGPVRPF